MKYNQIAPLPSLENAKLALERNGITTLIVENGVDAKNTVLSLIPQGSEVMTMTSVTAETIGLTKELDESGHYDSVRAKFKTMDRATQEREMNKLGSTPQYTVGSVHAVTEDGQVVIASNTGSQLPAYAYGAAKVIWVVGGQKVVKDLDSAMKRIYDYVLPLESERANKAYQITSGSFVSKLLIIKRELVKDRLTVILVKEPIGF